MTLPQDGSGVHVFGLLQRGTCTAQGCSTASIENSPRLTSVVMMTKNDRFAKGLELVPMWAELRPRRSDDLRGAPGENGPGAVCRAGGSRARRVPRRSGPAPPSADGPASTSVSEVALRVTPDVEKSACVSRAASSRRRSRRIRNELRTIQVQAFDVESPGLGSAPAGCRRPVRPRASPSRREAGGGHAGTSRAANSRL